ncbi:response regulator [bacterium]|nr:response regulator [bacterium]MBU1637078.1 response regulator [bacterium]MBU1921228.1 response regulator [bacterium]
MSDTYKILLVDDDPLVLSGFIEVLSQDSYDVTAVASGQEAIDILRAKEFDVVLTDMVMPRVSGLDVLRAALTQQPDSIVIVVTGYASVRSAVDALRLGAYDYVVKPCEDEELLYRVKMGIERSHLRNELRAKELDAEKMKAITQTAVTVNDQINTPLNVILNSAEYIRLKSLPDSPGVKQSLDFICQEVSKIKSVIHRLAEVADPNQVKGYPLGSLGMIDVDSEKTQKAGTKSNGHRRRILVVDDEQFMVHTLSKILDLMGYDVLSALGGKEAYEKYMNEQVDLVVSDVHMPEMNGIELLTSIKSHNPQIPVILVTGYGVEKARATAGECKADGFLGKPFKIQELKDLIQLILDSKESFSNSSSLETAAKSRVAS